METVKERLIAVRRTMTPEEWRDIKIYVHNDVEFEHTTLIATKTSDGKVYYYNLETEEFRPLNVSESAMPK